MIAEILAENGMDLLLHEPSSVSLSPVREPCLEQVLSVVEVRFN